MKRAALAAMRTIGMIGMIGMTGMTGMLTLTVALTPAPVSAQGQGPAQVTAFALIPSWTQSKVLVKDAHSGTAIASIPLAGEPYDVAITPDGRRAYVTLRASNQVAVIDLGTLQVVSTIDVGIEPRGIAVTPDGHRVWVTETGANTVSVIDPATNAVIGAPITVGHMPWGIAITPASDRAYVVDRGSSTVTAIDVATHAVLAVMSVDQEPVEIVIAPDGHAAYVTSTIANTVVPIDLDTHTVGPSIPVGLFPRDLAITSDGHQIFVSNSNSGTVSVIDVPSLSVADTISLGANAIPSGVTITPDGRHALVSTQTQDLRIIDVATHALLATIPVGGQALRIATTPNIIVPVTQGTPLSIASDADLTPLGFGHFITFRGGRLQATSNLFTSRHVSFLAQGGTIDTQQFNVDIAGSTVNDGFLDKRGTGTLTLSGNITHQGTLVSEGTLAILGTHPGGVRLGAGATLAGTGTIVGDVDASQGIISPGVNAPGDLYAGNVQMGMSHTLVIDINAVIPGQYDRLVSTGIVALNGATLMLNPGGPMPKGATFTIVTHASGMFAGLPEGSLIMTLFGRFRISYIGGPTQTDVVLKAI